MVELLFLKVAWTPSFLDWFSSSEPQLHLINFSSLMSTCSSSGVNLIQLNPKQNKGKAKLLHHFRQMQCKAPTSNQIKVSSLSMLSLNLCVVGWASYILPTDDQEASRIVAARSELSVCPSVSLSVCLQPHPD